MVNIVLSSGCDVKSQPTIEEHPLYEYSYNLSQCDLKSKINKNNIKFYPNKVIVYEDFTYGVLSDTWSMLPLVDETSFFILQDITKYNKEINICDIIIWKDPNSLEQYGHRVIYKGYDKEGLFYVTKGDNTKHNDAKKIREDMVRFMVVGILY